MTRFQLVFRRDGEGDQSELWANNQDGEPHIAGELVIDGQTYTIRGVDWILKQENNGHDGMKRFVCTLVVVDDETPDVAGDGRGAGV